MAKLDKVLSYYFDPDGGLLIVYLDGTAWKYKMTTEQFTDCLERSAPLDAIFEKIRTCNLVGVKAR